MTAYFTASAPKGDVAAPYSKSIAQRLLICAALAEGTSTLAHIPDCDDVTAAVNFAVALGATVDKKGDIVRVRGIGGKRCSSPVEFDALSSAATLRFAVPICRSLQREASITVSSQLAHREGIDGNVVHVGEPLLGGDILVPCDITSQHASGTLLALPKLMQDSRLCIVGDVTSAPYIALTADVMRRFGIRVHNTDSRTYTTAERYIGTDISNEYDASLAAGFLAFSALGCAVKVNNTHGTFPQADAVFPSLLDATTVDVTNCPDLAPILLAVASAKKGVTLLGTHRLMYKESDRAAAMAQELAKMGAAVTISADSITVSGGICAPTEPLDSHGDHRIAMALGVLLSLVGGRLTGAEAVSKTLPEFFLMLRQINVEVEVRP